MKNSKKCLLCLTLILFSLFGTGIVLFKLYRESNIDFVLKSQYYSYLSSAVQSYIKDVYDKTGEILLTEKNKEENKPYLNPDYIEYLNLSEEDKSSYAVIPSETIVDYVYNEDYTIESSDEIPSKFDLRNVDGKNFVTPIKDQGGTGLCWSFATNAQAESHLLIKNNQTYEQGKAQLFSEMQIDYATADNGVIDGETLYFYNRILSDGGTFKYATTVMKDGLGLVDVSWRDFDTYDEKSMEKNQVYNYTNSNYDVISAVDYPKLDLGNLDLSVSTNVTKRESYLNNLKKLIMENGGAYVATGDPSGRCSIYINGYKMIYDDTICASAGHAMQIIGWDDDFEYSFCSGQKDSYNYYYLSNSNNCTTGKVISGKGVWILKNSWGNSLPYVYLAYDSIGTEYNMITEMEEKDWDNNYLVESSNFLKYVYNKNNFLTEKLNKIKFRTSGQNFTASICVNSALSEEDICRTVVVTYPGIYTVDFGNDNIFIDDDLYINVSQYLTYDGINIYTNVIDDDMEIYTEDVIFETRLTDIDKYFFRISSRTVNVPEGALVEYKILDEDDNEIITNYEYSENIVSANFIFSKLYIDNDLKFGSYKLQTILDGVVMSESSLIVNEKNVVTYGSGTIDDPYIITNPSQLNLIRLDRFAYYKLANDIDLTYDTQNERGLFYNDGKGWEPIRYSTSSISSYLEDIYFSKGFSGGFDGDNFRIKGLYINRPTENGIGLFANTYNENYSDLYIKNVILENPIVIGNDYVGSLIGGVNGTTNERMTNISNISIIGGTVKGNDYVGGIFGSIRAGSNLKKYGTTDERHKFSNLYNSATVNSNNYSGGIAGKVISIIGYGDGKCPMIIENILNKGTILSMENAAGIAGYIKARDDNSIGIKNSINTGYVKGNSKTSNIMSEFSDSSVGVLNLSNIYYLTEENVNFNNAMISVDNVTNMSLSDMKNTNNFTSWGTFNTYWKIETVDEITRLPVLKFLDFNYLSVNDISIKIGENANIKDYIEPDIDAVLNTMYTIDDERIVKISSEGIIEALSSGTTKLNVVSHYDGYEKVVNINVLDWTSKAIISFDSKGGSDVNSIIGEAGSSVNAPDDPVKVGYKFLGWYLDDNTFEQKYEFNVMPEENIILYARWEQLKYKVTFNANGGTGEMPEQEFAHGELQKLNANIFTKEGYNFIGWNTKLDGSGTSYTDSEEINITEDITLYSQWKLIKYKVTFDSNTGKGEMLEQEYLPGQIRELYSNEFTKLGYNFIGWNTEIDGSGISYSDGEEITVTENITLYAQWEAIIYKVTFKANGGTGTMPDQEFVYCKFQNLNANTFTREGYKFKGWTNKPDSTTLIYKNKESIYVTSDLTLYALWEIEKVKVAMVGNNSKPDDIKYQEFVPGELQKLNPNTFTREGYIFVGWNTKTDGSGISYSDGEEISITNHIVLYAQWEAEKTYIINKYDVDLEKKYIDKIDVNTTLDEYLSNITLFEGYSILVDTKTIDNKQVMYTGGKTKIYKGKTLYEEFTNIVMGDASGDGKINYLDYVYVYNHIYKTKHPESDKALLENVYNKAGDYKRDGKIDYLDYVYIYNKIKELKGETN